jgi:hypothetical protein
MSFCVVAILKGRGDGIDELKNELLRTFGSTFPGFDLYAYWDGDRPALDEIDGVIAAYVNQLRADYVSPGEVWIIGARIFEFANNAVFTQ